MQVYHSEEEQIEVLKQWWRENGSLFISVIVITLLLACAWHFWQYRQVNRRTSAAIIYESLQTQPKNVAPQLSRQLLKQYKGTLYAEFAAFRLAASAAEAHDWSTAKRYLSWNLKHARHTPMRYLARIRLASIALMQKNPEEVLAILDATHGLSHSFWGNWLCGKAQLMQGHTTQAHTSFVLAQKAMQNQSVSYAFDASSHMAQSMQPQDHRNQRAIFQTLLASDIQRTQPNPTTTHTSA